MFVGPGSKDIWHYNQHGRHELEGLWDSRTADVMEIFRQQHHTVISECKSLAQGNPQDSGNDCYVEGDWNSLGAIISFDSVCERCMHVEWNSSGLCSQS